MATVVSLEDYKDAQERRTARYNQIRVTGNAAKVKKPICFDRDELGTILSLYSQMVARGVWRDYAIDQIPGQAIFSVFKSSKEAPTYMISKQATASGKGREFQIYHGQRKLKRTERLTDALTALHMHAS